MVENFGQKVERRGGKYKNPRVFTKQEVWMLSTILKSKIAINMTINIIDAFVYMRKYISTNLIEQSYINKMVIKDNERINILESTFNELKEKKKVYHLGASINHASSKTFSINILEDEIVVSSLIDYINVNCH